MSGVRQSQSKQFFVASDKQNVYDACVKAGKQVGKVKDENPVIGSLTVKTSLKFFPPRNPVTMLISVMPVDGGCEVRCESDSCDGAVGFGSAPKSINEFCNVLATFAKDLPAPPVKDTGSNNATDANDPMAQIKKLKELLDMGALTQEEFNAKKKELLNL